MSDETPEAAPEEEKSAEDRIYEILGEEPFYDDRVDILLNCVVSELEDQGLLDSTARELYGELRGIVDKFELRLEEKPN